MFACESIMVFSGAELWGFYFRVDSGYNDLMEKLSHFDSNLGQPKIYLQNPHFKMAKKFLSEGTYSEAIESFVIVDTDVVLVNKDSKKILLLARRRHKPMQGLWVIGGRIFAGENELSAIQRIFKRETSLEIAPSRFHFVAMNRYIWSEREQEPQDKGSDNLCYTFGLVLDANEIKIVSGHLDKEEYDSSSGLQEFSREELINENVHPAIIDLYDSIFHAS